MNSVIIFRFIFKGAFSGRQTKTILSSKWNSCTTCELCLPSVNMSEVTSLCKQKAFTARNFTILTFTLSCRGEKIFHEIVESSRCRNAKLLTVHCGSGDDPEIPKIINLLFVRKHKKHIRNLISSWSESSHSTKHEMKMHKNCLCCRHID